MTMFARVQSLVGASVNLAAHGVAASLVTGLVATTFVYREVCGRTERTAPPDESESLKTASNATVLTTSESAQESDTPQQDAAHAQDHATPSSPQLARIDTRRGNTDDVHKEPGPSVITELDESVPSLSPDTSSTQNSCPLTPVGDSSSPAIDIVPFTATPAAQLLAIKTRVPDDGSVAAKLTKSQKQKRRRANARKRDAEKADAGEKELELPSVAHSGA